MFIPKNRELYNLSINKTNWINKLILNLIIPLDLIMLPLSRKPRLWNIQHPRNQQLENHFNPKSINLIAELLSSTNLLWSQEQSINLENVCLSAKIIRTQWESSNRKWNLVLKTQSISCHLHNIQCNILTMMIWMVMMKGCWSDQLLSLWSSCAGLRKSARSLILMSEHSLIVFN